MLESSNIESVLWDDWHVVAQPKASPIATEGYDVDYICAALRPYIVVLYKANPAELDRKDMITSNAC